MAYKKNNPAERRSKGMKGLALEAYQSQLASMKRSGASDSDLEKVRKAIGSLSATMRQTKPRPRKRTR